MCSTGNLKAEPHPAPRHPALPERTAAHSASPGAASQAWILLNYTLLQHHLASMPSYWPGVSREYTVHLSVAAAVMRGANSGFCPLEINRC